MLGVSAEIHPCRRTIILQIAAPYERFTRAMKRLHQIRDPGSGIMRKKTQGNLAGLENHSLPIDDAKCPTGFSAFGAILLPGFDGHGLPGFRSLVENGKYPSDS